MSSILLIHACSAREGRLDWNSFRGIMGVFEYVLDISLRQVIVSKKTQKNSWASKNKCLILTYFTGQLRVGCDSALCVTFIPRSSPPESCLSKGRRRKQWQIHAMAEPHNGAITWTSLKSLLGRGRVHAHWHFTEADHVAEPAINVWLKWIHPLGGTLQATWQE